MLTITFVEMSELYTVLGQDFIDSALHLLGWNYEYYYLVVHDPETNFVAIPHYLKNLQTFSLSVMDERTTGMVQGMDTIAEHFH